MVVEEFHDQKIIYHLNIDEEVNNILMHLSSLKTIKTNRVIKGTTLVGAFYIFSLFMIALINTFCNFSTLKPIAANPILNNKNIHANNI